MNTGKSGGVSEDLNIKSSNPHYLAGGLAIPYYCRGPSLGDKWGFSMENGPQLGLILIPDGVATTKAIFSQLGTTSLNISFNSLLLHMI